MKIVWLVLVVVGAIGAGVSYWSSGEAQPSHAHQAFAPDPPRRLYQDLAVACLLSGTATPPVEELEADTFDAIVHALARVLEMHMEGDFDAYLAGRLSGLSSVDEVRSADVVALQEILVNELGVPRKHLPRGWTSCLRRYWELLYEVPAIREILPPSTKLIYRATSFASSFDAGGALDLEAYDHSFESRRSSFLVRINNAMAIPHRRSAHAIAMSEGSLAWFDVELGAILSEGTHLCVTIVLRFVWDSLEQEWFLSRAVTGYPDHFDLRSSRAVLLL